MSKFVDKLQNLAKSSGTPIGFRPSASEAESSAMLLIVGLSGAKVNEAKRAADINADAGLIIDQIPSARVVGQMVEAAGGIPLGVFIDDAAEEKANELVSSGCDFLVLGIKAAAAILQNEEVGKFLMVEPSLDYALVRAINSLEIDGVFLSKGIDSFVAVQDLLVCRRFVEFLEKPVMITLPPCVTKAELVGLSQVGVEGVVALPTESAEALAELKKLIDDLPRGIRTRRGGVGVMLPGHAGAVLGEEDEEEEEI
ncbi:MAG: hypothetical protein ACLFVA_05840 [Dehalococcoidia bacterium]